MTKVDLSGLDNFNISDLMSEKPLEVAGKALMIPIEKIVEDAQVRKEMDQDALKELAASIKEHGVKSPISVKSANADGKYQINFGHRRFRASKLSGNITIPAFIDDEHTDFHQVIENIHREELSPMEITHFIQRRLEAGDKKSEIAKSLGKPASYISDHAAMLEMDKEILNLYNKGLCRSIQVLANLHRIHKKHPEQVVNFCKKIHSDLTFSQVRIFAEKLKKTDIPKQETKQQIMEIENKGENFNNNLLQSQKGDYSHCDSGNIKEEVKLKQATIQIQKPTLQVKHDNRYARLIIDRKPSNIGMAWLIYDDCNSEIEVQLINVELIAII